jgi:hypothetical protein
VPIIQSLFAVSILLFFLQRDSLVLPLCRRSLRTRVRVVYIAVMFVSVVATGEFFALASPSLISIARSPLAWMLAILMQILLLILSRNAAESFIDGRPWLLAVVPAPLLLISFGAIVYAIRARSEFAPVLVPILACGWILAVVLLTDWQVRTRALLEEPLYGLVLSRAINGMGVALVPLLLFESL